MRINLTLMLTLAILSISGAFNITKAGPPVPTPPPIPVTFEECMFVGTDNQYECFCSGDGKNFFKIECTQERFDFCVYDVLGEVKRLFVVGDTAGNEYSLDLECSNVAYCGNGAKELGEECDTGMSGVSGDCTNNNDICNVKNGCTCEADTCGNGIVGNDEECDDGDTTNGDGCDENCKIECTEDCSIFDNACATGVCSNGECALNFLPDGTPCDDMNPCTINDTCSQFEEVSSCIGEDICS